MGANKKITSGTVILLVISILSLVGMIAYLADSSYVGIANNLVTILSICVIFVAVAAIIISYLKGENVISNWSPVATGGIITFIIAAYVGLRIPFITDWSVGLKAMSPGLVCAAVSYIVALVLSCTAVFFPIGKRSK